MVAVAAAAAVTLTLHPGNHDITLDADFYAQHGLSFHNQHPQSSKDCLELLKSSPSITYLNHESAVIKLNGPGTTFKIFGSPYSPACGLWAFGYESTEEAFHLWDQIPMDTDVVVTHTPPKYHCDGTKGRGYGGCEVLRQMLWRVRPRLSVCGHVHEGRGADRIRWDLHESTVKYRESDTKHWIDPAEGNKKQSLIDLTARGGAALDYETANANEPTRRTEPHPPSSSSRNSAVLPERTSFKPKNYQVPWVASLGFHGDETNAVTHSSTDPTSTELGSDRPTVAGSSVRLPSSIEGAVFDTRGQGGIHASGPCDMEALSGRMGRKETCVINAAIKASSWTPKSGVVKRFNKPIVVDIDMPVWRAPADDISG